VSVETLLTWLERDAAAECARIATAAEDEAAEIERQAVASAEQVLAAEAERARAETERAIARSLSAVTRRQRERMLRARADLVDRTFAAAARTLAVLPLDRYRHRLDGLIDETLRYLEGSPATLRCPLEVAPIAREVTAGRGMVSIDPLADAAAGVIGTSADGAVTVDNTWPSRLARRRADLAIALVHRITEPGDHALG
jgi:vacuolar-type H+-ATPase subunit E/Vma4